MENGPFTVSVIFLLKPPFTGNFPLPRLITRGYNLLFVLMTISTFRNSCTIGPVVALQAGTKTIIEGDEGLAGKELWGRRWLLSDSITTAVEEYVAYYIPSGNLT